VSACPSRSSARLSGWLEKRFREHVKMYGVKSLTQTEGWLHRGWQLLLVVQHLTPHRQAYRCDLGESKRCVMSW
jgi:hypothetical protein